MSNTQLNRLHLILGGARSGKSRLAENIAKKAESEGLTVCYLATAQAHDEEMTRTLSMQSRRGPLARRFSSWMTGSGFGVRTDLPILTPIWRAGFNAM